MLAVLQAHDDIVSKLLSANAHVNLKGKGGNTAMHLACEKRRYAIAL
jgi:ankyrin repeat protein